MTGLFLNSSEQGLVVFPLWKSLEYKKRLWIASALVLLGLIWQLITMALLPGVLFLLAGTALVLPSGVDNRAKIGKYDPAADWENIEEEKLTDFLGHIQKVRRWDLSSLDISNWVGGFLFFFLFVGLLLLFFMSEMEWEYRYMSTIAIDGAILFFPFWFSGLRLSGIDFGVQTTTSKIKILLALANDKNTKEMRGPHTLDYFVLLAGKGNPMPRDAKFRINIKDHHKDFMGLYGQIVTNTVQNAPHMYFYIVMVAKKGYGLKAHYKKFNTRKTPLTKSFKEQDDVEVFVIRQNTKKVTNGYRTTKKQITHIYEQGLIVAQQAALK